MKKRWILRQRYSLSFGKIWPLKWDQVRATPRETYLFIWNWSILMDFLFKIFRLPSKADEMDIANDELRDTIQMIWPLQAKHMMDLLVPKNDQLNDNHLTVGKIYAGLLILESWRSTRFGKKRSRLPVSNHWEWKGIVQYLFHCTKPFEHKSKE